MQLRAYLLLIGLLFTLLVHSCSESNPVSDEHGEHARANGIKISSDGVTRVHYFQEQKVQGNLQAQAGQMTSHHEIEFFDVDSVLFIPEQDEYRLRWDILDTSLVSIWQHDGEEGGFEFHLVGKKSGMDSIIFMIYHDNHPDFTSKKIPVIVN